MTQFFKKGILNLLLLVGLSPLVFAQTYTVDNSPMETQRREFEKQLNEKVDKSMGMVLPAKSYIVNVTVKMRPIPPEEIDIGGGVENDDLEPFKVLELAQDPELLNGLIPLSKIGYWQPQQLAKKSAAKKMIKRTRNFFEFISGVAVDVMLDTDIVSKEQRSSAQAIVTSLVKRASPVEPTFSFKDMKIYYPEVKGKTPEEIIADYKKEQEASGKKDEEAKRMSLVDWVKELKIAGALLFFTFMLFLLGIVVHRSHLKFQNRKLQIEEEQSRRQEEALRQSTVKEGEAKDGLGQADLPVIEASASFEEERLNSGFKLLLGIIHSEPAKAVYLIKNWINEGTKESELCLATLPRLISVEKLSELLSYFNEEDRKKWNKFISSPTDRSTYYVADRYVSRHIISMMIAPPPPISDEIKGNIASLTSHEAAEISKSSADLGALLLYILPSQQIGRMFQALDVQSIQAITSRSGQITSQNMGGLSAQLVQAIEKLKLKQLTQSNPFLEKAPELIREVGFDKENVLFDNIGSTRNAKALLAIAKENLPAELVGEIPIDILKVILAKLTLLERAELIFSQDEKNKDLLYSAVATSDRVKEILDTELVEINSNEVRSKTLKRSSKKMWQEFVNRVRQTVNSDTNIRDEVLPIIESWVTRKTGVNDLGDVSNAA